MQTVLRTRFRQSLPLKSNCFLTKQQKLIKAVGGIIISSPTSAIFRRAVNTAFLRKSAKITPLTATLGQVIYLVAERLCELYEYIIGRAQLRCCLCTYCARIYYGLRYCQDVELCARRCYNGRCVCYLFNNGAQYKSVYSNGGCNCCLYGNGNCY